MTVVGPISEQNLNARIKDHIARAKLEPWPKSFVAMRSSCEQDWKTKGVAEPTYTVWLGHSAAVSRDHYISPTDAEFTAISGRASDAKENR